MVRPLAVVALALLAAGCGTTAPPRPAAGSGGAAESGAALPTVAAKTAGMDRRDGFMPVYWDAKAGKVWLEVPALDTDLLYTVALAAGLGSNDVGLDRSQLGGERVVRFERVGPRVLLVQPNLRFRATSDNAAERLAVEDAFAPSVVWGFDVAAETPGEGGAGGAVLVDATDFVVRDAHGVAQRLKATGQGTFALDKTRSAPAPAAIKAFPRNTELEARLTFASDAPGRFVRDVAADPNAVTVRVRQSFVALPPPGYTPRRFDPASGYFPTGYADYATPIGEEVEQRFITRHRLECSAPPDASGLCAPVEPIVYYLDPGTPEPVRSALLDGARWWADAFTAAGFRDAYRVEVRPDSVDPLDVRYSTIQWVHRATRGWSYGASVVDPRTGEILKGHVSLGSLRVRQDYLLAEGLLAPYAGDRAAGFSPEDDPMLALALARLRQLSAHEVGHTIGLAHNFAASTQDRASVMDYPAPLALPAAGGPQTGGAVDLAEAYAVGVGDWDVQAVRYGYTPDEGALPAILAENRARGLLYLTDADARPAGAASPVAALWDNGTDAVASLRTEMEVRRRALDRFGEAAVRQGRPLATLEEVLVPLYLRHRYQVEATAHLVGGVAYAYAARGDGAAPPAPVPGDVQRAALGALLETVTPEALALPEAARAIPPRPPGYGPTRELFGGRTGLTFDPVAPAETAAALVFGFLLEPDRAARLAYQPAVDPSLPSFTDVLDRTTTALRSAPAPTTYLAEVRRAALVAWVEGLVGLASDDGAAPTVRARVVDHALDLATGLAGRPDDASEDAVLGRWLADQIFRYLDRGYEPSDRVEPVAAPPGSPIGQ